MTKVLLDDDVGDGVEYEANVVGIGRASEVGVNLLLPVLTLVQILKLHLDIRRRLLIRVRACNTSNVTQR